MAAKNPNRVAAGKKAWANRGKGKSRGRGRGRGGGSRRRPIQRGVCGKVGAIILGVVPPVIAGTDAAQHAVRVKKQHGLSAVSAVHYGLIRFLNNLTNGFVGVEAFTASIPFVTEGGQQKSFPAPSGLPRGSLLTVAGTGLLLLLFDAVASKISGGRPIKIPMTNYNAIGGS